jgi:purine-nucleoside phosphorylase
MHNDSALHALSLLRSRGIGTPDVAVILGSGLGGFEQKLENSIIVPYADIPGFPEVNVAGHAGLLGFGDLSGKKVLVFSGRFHFYEGHKLTTTVLPVQLAAALGAKHLIVTNAAGGINESYGVGDFMNIMDTLRIMKSGIGAPLEWPRISSALVHQDMVQLAAKKTGLKVHNGTYLFVTGPNYETPAEIRMFRYMGADAVGMSTVPELIEAGKLGLKCAGISLITNAASGVTDVVLDHADVKDVAERSSTDFAKMMTVLLGLI